MGIRLDTGDRMFMGGRRWPRRMERWLGRIRGWRLLDKDCLLLIRKSGIGWFRRK